MATDPPRRWVIPVALLPAVPVFSFLSLISLPGLRTLPAQWRWVLALFTATQLVAASLTPDPLLSVPLALGRVLLTLGLILTGVRLGSSGALRPALIGYAVVAVTAFTTTTLLHPTELLSVRLQHPYLTQVSLGLAGTLGLLLAVTWKGGPVLWRILAGSLSLGMFLWSGSRGPLIALAAGLLAALIVSQGRQLRAVLLTALGAAALILGAQNQLPSTNGSVTSRFLENTLNGRGTYWADALDAARAYPLGGTGPYQLGPRLSTQYSDGSCNLWLKNDTYGLTECPPALNAARGAWLIAHNTLFHLLGETGLIGTLGWLALIGTLAVTAARTRDPLLNAVTWATAGMGLVDNPTLLPNIGHAELYWLSGGVTIALVTTHARKQANTDPTPAMAEHTAAAHLPTVRHHRTVLASAATPAMATVLAVYFAAPVWVPLVQPGQPVPAPVIEAVTVPGTLVAGQTSTVAIRTIRPANATSDEDLRVQVMICPAAPQSVATPAPSLLHLLTGKASTGTPCPFLTWLWIAPGTHWRHFNLTGPQAGAYDLQFRYLTTETTLRVERPTTLLSVPFRTTAP